MKIIVTGVSGFVGGHIARHLIAKGHHVVGLSRREIPNSKIKHIRTDLTKPVTSKLPYRRYDAVVHCAALTMQNAPYEQAFSINVLGTKHTYYLAKKLKAKKFIHISSFSVYKEFTDRLRVNENYPKTTKKGSTYSRTKFEAEGFLQKQNGTHLVCLRPHIIYGPGDVTVLSQFLRMVKFNKLFLPMKSPKEVSATYVLNLAEGVEFFLKQNVDPGFHAYNISDKQTLDSVTLVRSFLNFTSPRAKITFVPKEVGYAMARIITFIARIQRKEPKLTADLVNQLNNNSSASIEKLTNLGFEPKYSFNEGLKSTKSWFDRFEGVEEFLSASKYVWPKIELR